MNKKFIRTATIPLALLVGGAGVVAVVNFFQARHSATDNPLGLVASNAATASPSTPTSTGTHGAMRDRQSKQASSTQRQSQDGSADHDSGNGSTAGKGVGNPAADAALAPSASFADAVLGRDPTPSADKFIAKAGAPHFETGAPGNTDDFGLSTVEYLYIGASDRPTFSQQLPTGGSGSGAIPSTPIGNGLPGSRASSGPNDQPTLVSPPQTSPSTTPIGASPVPEPNSYALLLAGLGLIGTITVRRRAKHI